jgi:hypothetical protein
MKIEVTPPQPTFEAVSKKQGNQVVKAYSSTATTVAASLRKQGRADTKTAGKFGAWAFSVKTKKDGELRIIRAYAGSKVVEQLEFGATIKGRPLLFIRFSFATDAPRNPRKYTGELVRVERKVGTPILVQAGGDPKYFGVPQVVMPRKLHLRDIGRDLVDDVPRIYSDKLSAAAG